MANNSLVTLAIVALIVSAVAAGYAYTTSNNLITGYVSTTATGTVNLSIESSVAISFIIGNISFGSGRVNSGSDYAILNTAGGVDNVSGGNWTGNTDGFLPENIGNVNISLNLVAGKSAVEFIGGSNPAYQWNVTNNQAGSCLNSTGGVDALNLSIFMDVVKDGGFNYCPRMTFADESDSVRIDIRLVVPSDSFTGSLEDTITATATI